MRIGFSIGMRLKSLCSLLLNNMKNVARNILCQLLRLSQWRSWRWLCCFIRWTLWFQIWRTGIQRMNSYTAGIKTQQPVYKFSCKKVFMRNWIPLEMSLVGIKEVVIWPDAYELFLHFLLLLLAPHLHKSLKFCPCSHAHLHCGLPRTEKRNSFVEGFLPKFKMTLLNPDEP
jgi:hypothetical protein